MSKPLKGFIHDNLTTKTKSKEEMNKNIIDILI